MKVLIVHARYRQPSGEEVVVAIQSSVLVSLGHEVVLFERRNDEVGGSGALGQAREAVATVWSEARRREVGAAIAADRPDVVHVHNTFPSLSTSIYAAANAAGVPVVQHLHNARLVCANPWMFRDHEPCTDCVGRRVPWPAVVHRCYHDSVTHSGVAAAVQLTNHALGISARRVDLFLPVSDWLGTLVVESGAVPAAKVLVCHSGLDPDPGARPVPTTARPDGGYAVFVGRLAVEKGVDTLLAAAALVPELPLKIAGDGPDRGAIAAAVAAAGLAQVELLGHVDRTRVLELLRGARVSVTPSNMGDSLPMSAVEGAACGVPAIGSRAGGIPEIIVDGVTGFLVPPGNPTALARALRTAATDPVRMAAMGQAARRHFEKRFAARRMGERLLEAYEVATANAAAAGRRRGVGPVGRLRRMTPTDAGHRNGE